MHHPRAFACAGSAPANARRGPARAPVTPRLDEGSMLPIVHLIVSTQRQYPQVGGSLSAGCPAPQPARSVPKRKSSFSAASATSAAVLGSGSSRGGESAVNVT